MKIPVNRSNGKFGSLCILQIRGAHAPSRLRDDEAAPAAQARVPVGASPTNAALARGTQYCKRLVQGCGEAPQPAREARALPRNSCEISELAVSFCVSLCLLCQLGCGNHNSEAPSKKQASSDAFPSSITSKAAFVPMTNMVLIKAGTFVRLKHSVTLSRDFWLGKYEVTQAEYLALMGKNPSHFKGDPSLPVEKVSYLDALAYCSTVTKRERDSGRLPLSYEYRLPSEAEWEYACRAGTTNFFSFGETVTEAEAHQYAWTTENSGGSTHAVGQKRPNPWGLHDIHGNVWEWTLDWFGDYPAADVTDPAGPAEGKVKVFRGGGWNNEIQFARSANRFGMAPSNGIHFVGFRIALSQAKP